MKIRIDFTWYRSRYNQDNVTSFVILNVAEKSKRGVTKAIRDYVKGWSGKGYVLVDGVSTAFADDFIYTEIKQRKFLFNN